MCRNLVKPTIRSICQLNCCGMFTLRCCFSGKFVKIFYLTSLYYILCIVLPVFTITFYTVYFVYAHPVYCVEHFYRCKSVCLSNGFSK